MTQRRTRQPRWGDSWCWEGCKMQLPRVHNSQQTESHSSMHESMGRSRSKVCMAVLRLSMEGLDTSFKMAGCHGHGSRLMPVSG